MLVVAHLCKSAPFRTWPSKQIIHNTRVFNNGLSRQLFTGKRFVTVGVEKKINTYLLSRVSNLMKVRPVLTRLTSSVSNPNKTNKLVGYWLLGCSGMVFTAVVLGGVTRLTESGLSMVTWKLLGERMPTSDESWIEEFEKYKQYPEFKYKNRDITLSEFKMIWWMEYAHRTWGRLIGGAVLLPAAVLLARRSLDARMAVRVAVYCALVAAQGLMGWYMVKSGLEDRFSGPSDVPRVSQYRLAAHLGLAFVLYAGLLMGALRVLRPRALATAAVEGLLPVRRLAHSVKGIAFFTALSGAFVAGLDAGLVYNSFPMMGSHWVPPETLEMAPLLRNLTENPVTVQLQHRILGTLTLATTLALWLVARKRKLPAPAGHLVHAVAGMALAQVALGIATLVHYVPVSLGAAHQAGSLSLLSLALWLTHELKLLKRIPK